MNFSLKLITFLVLIFAITSCRSDSQENSRAYAEGKIIFNNIDLQNYRLKITVQDKIVAETMIDADGSFKLSGPISGEGFSIVSTEKIRSFNTDKTGLTLSADSFKINVPKGITYLKFNEIVLEK
ncbi:hypothetical protein AP75_10075 [Kaistella haifensis DSM 19056]|uniref:DUF4369 domain-containing protein n=1 Tax=Kaistella haifensis DSM 19056 TaxID=1450526 RepID=A0A246B8F9_9FLAO|nr:hypothetical protein [Kaistella haifensis]OWK97650.1 hypothetical protein AP75_10075 [Kaistella haifensis DSM 19056]